MTDLFIVHILINWTRKNVFDTGKKDSKGFKCCTKICPIYAFYLHFYGNFYDVDEKHSVQKNVTG